MKYVCQLTENPTSRNLSERACMRAQLLSCVRLFVTLWTAACQAPRSMEFSRQEYLCGVPFATPGDLPDPGIRLMSPASPAVAGRFFLPLCHLGSQGFPYLLPFPPIIPLFYPFSLNSTSEIKASQIWNHLVWTSRLNRHRFEIIRVRRVLTQHLPTLQLVTSHPGDSFHRHTMSV